MNAVFGSGAMISMLVTTRFALIALFGLINISALAADPRAGSWTLVAAQCSLDPADKLSIVSADGTVHVLMRGETHVDLTAKADGKQLPVLANPVFDQIQLHRISKKQVEVIEKKNGALVAQIRNALSKDGSELTLTTSRPGHPDQITVWIRNEATKPGPDPFAGDWTQDVSKTRMKQGMLLTIEALGGDAVRFSGEYSYTAHFDGKPYDLKNSPNDTVQLTQVDGHIVEAAYRRDQQVTQRDRWVVTPDGKSMTLVSSGELETGQHFNEKLVFQRKP